MLYALITGKGKVLQHQSNDLVPEGSGLRAMPVVKPVDADTHLFDGKRRKTRPKAPKIAATGTAPYRLPLGRFKNPKDVTIHDAFGNSMTLTKFAEPLRLVDVGTYRLVVRQHFPHHNVDMMIEVKADA